MRSRHLLLAASAVIIVQQPPVAERVGELERARGDGLLFEVVALAVDAAKRAAVSAAGARAELPYEELAMLGQGREAPVEVAGDPGAACFGDTVRRPGRVVTARLSEEHDLGAVIRSAQNPRLLAFGERPPEVVAAARLRLRREPPSAVRPALEAHQCAFPVLP